MSETLNHLILAHGYWIVAAIVGLESMGIPLPGETTLVTAGIYAGTTHHLNIAFVIAAAAVGAIAGDNLGFWVGRKFGYDFAVRHSRVLRLTSTRLEIGRYLFQRHGGKVVFFGRFFSGLRTFAAFLAGVNWMPWARFLWFNVAGGAVWATIFGSAAYVFGRQFEDLNGSISIVGLIVAVVAVSFGFWFARRYEAQLESMVKKEEKSPAEAGHYVGRSG
ncbi:MAG TPA: DedA family protein [Vicinamibacterales bacterium]